MVDGGDAQRIGGRGGTWENRSTRREAGHVRGAAVPKVDVGRWWPGGDVIEGRRSWRRLPGGDGRRRAKVTKGGSQ